MNSWQTKKSKIVYENPWMVVKEDEFVSPTGSPGIYGYVSAKDETVFVIPIDTDGNTYLIQQEHYPSRRTDWQFVGGKCDDESPEIAAKRELHEETGLEATSITVLKNLQVATGLSTFSGVYCLAEGINTANLLFDKEEGIIAIKKVPLSDVAAMIFNGEIHTAESIALYFLACAHIERRGRE